MKLRDRIRRRWTPAKWRDEHPEISDGEGYALTEGQRAEMWTSRDVRAGTMIGPSPEPQAVAELPHEGFHN
jgi:hypothetical protein